ncbi:MAG: NADH-quinone oxidoreductase subunit N [Prevotellaceae bacterium]|nr:NADH-quinone oxidoreductase subunit N [Prevotellaceae bacterium]MDY6130045.1 NADH-quinone oxidoreductase subunit N [Prevotella sp.]
MNYSQFLNMIPEATLMAILVIAFIADFATAKQAERRWFNPLVCVLFLAQTVVSFYQSKPVEAFGGMYVTTVAVNVMKTILAGGTLIVVIQSKKWLSRPDTSFKEGEFYMLVAATLLGMNMMMSAGHFLMFFLGLEMASVPMACLVALDKYRHNSAEAAAKFILMATFSSGVMLYGISFLYGSCGTLYFNDFTLQLSMGNHPALSITGLVFFMSGLGFKISLVPFHFWTADSYQGAPTTVTGYLSVISKGAAAFALCALLMKVFSPLQEYWEYVLYVLIVLSITVANLFAIRQSELKRFMAFSSISQAGYIMLSTIGSSAAGATALSYYILVYIVANLAVFTVIGVVEENNHGITEMEAYNGLYATNPKLSFLLTVALFSLAGIPPFAGMFSKFFVFMAAAKQGSFLAYFVVFVALINTVVSLYYYLLIVKAMYIKTSDRPLPEFKSDFNTKIALAICVAGIALCGVCSFFYDWISAAV